MWDGGWAGGSPGLSAWHVLLLLLFCLPWDSGSQGTKPPQKNMSRRIRGRAPRSFAKLENRVCSPLPSAWLVPLVLIKGNWCVGGVRQEAFDWETILWLWPVIWIRGRRGGSSTVNVMNSQISACDQPSRMSPTGSPQSWRCAGSAPAAGTGRDRLGRASRAEPLQAMEPSPGMAALGSPERQVIGLVGPLVLMAPCWRVPLALDPRV